MSEDTSEQQASKAESSQRQPEKYGDDPNSAIDAQAAVIMQKGFLDDVIDGIKLGVIFIAFITLILAVVLGGSLPTLFPATQPVFDFVKSLPALYASLPEYVAAVREGFPRSLEEAGWLAAVASEWFGEMLHRMPYKGCVLVFSWATYLWEAKLDIRQRDRLHEVRRPAAIAPFVSRQAYLEASAYGLDKSSLVLVKNAFMQAQTTAIIVYDMTPWMWTAVGDAMQTYLGLGEEYEITRSVAYFVVATLISTVLALPFDLYSTFVVEKKHGFNKQTGALFFSDLAKNLMLTFFLGGPILALFLWVIGKTGSQFYLYAWALLAAVQLLIIVIYPTFIQPMFNKFSPLPEGELRTAIEALASRLGFPLKKLYVVDGSKRSSHSNAYVFGFFKSKRIVVFDTLIEQCTTEEIVAIIGHELGHWKKNHVLRMLSAVQVQTFVVFFAFSHFIGEEAMYRSFGMETMPVLIGFMFFQYLYQPLDSLLTFASNVMSRKHEFEADAFSKKLGYGKELASSLIKLQIENKGNMNPDPLYSAYHYSHPPLVERLNAINDPEVAPKTE
ncbi:zinc metalloprotease [Coemansia sp. RSA 2675]|uniref:Zinc metalloprotease n=1 Tax=Coemansia linderi TaxID=2663919 RepID=A0ACC1KNW7_9FUNG|nr:zinc metalloprotease [Coemansia sp. RSA 2675]KAJ2792685.1 zinc metalloprotease [Coemansia linderi]